MELCTRFYTVLGGPVFTASGVHDELRLMSLKWKGIFNDSAWSHNGGRESAPLPRSLPVKVGDMMGAVKADIKKSLSHWQEYVYLDPHVIGHGPLTPIQHRHCDFDRWEHQTLAYEDMAVSVIIAVTVTEIWVWPNEGSDRECRCRHGEMCGFPAAGAEKLVLQPGQVLLMLGCLMHAGAAGRDGVNDKMDTLRIHIHMLPVGSRGKPLVKYIKGQTYPA